MKDRINSGFEEDKDHQEEAGNAYMPSDNSYAEYEDSGDEQLSNASSFNWDSDFMIGDSSEDENGISKPIPMREGRPFKASNDGRVNLEVFSFSRTCTTLGRAKYRVLEKTKLEYIKCYDKLYRYGYAFKERNLSSMAFIRTIVPDLGGPTREISGIPCKHVMAVITEMRIYNNDFVHKYLTTEVYIKIYLYVIYPIPDETQWP
ncbi:hypothetical protein Q3G72_002204 [Acer saccharum]|nr:hypothetical protein Q3G72_002204 [Acer saccharum]